MSEMVERVARAILKRRFYDCEPEAYGHREDTFWEDLDPDHILDAHDEAIAAIKAMGEEPSSAFLDALAERMHDARFSRSGETHPVTRNFIRSFVDAALEGEGR